MLKNIKKIFVFILFISIISLFISTLNVTYCYPEFNDNGTIDLRIEDILELNEEDYSKVTSLIISNEVPDGISDEVYAKLVNLETISIYHAYIPDITFINSIDSTKNMFLFIGTSVVDLDGIDNDKITNFSITTSEVSNFKDIENLTNLVSFGMDYINGYEMLDFTKFPNLASLVYPGYIEDFEAFFESIPNVSTLSLGGSNIQNKDALLLKNLTSLKSLNLSCTYLTDIDFVRNLTSLEELVLPWAVTDLSPIYDLPNLTYLRWDAYTELFVTQELVDYLDSHNIDHYHYNPNTNSNVNNIISELNLDPDVDVKTALEEISKYLLEHTSTEIDYSLTFGNPSGLDLIINHNMGVCYNHEIAVYTISKVLGLNDVYGIEGILRINTGITYGDDDEPLTQAYSFMAHGWNVVNYDGIWYGIDVAQMNENTLSVNDLLFEANFFKNPFEDDDYDYNYSLANYLDYNYFFYRRHIDTSGILKQTQYFQFDNIDGLDIRNHVIYNYDVTDNNASNLCSRVLDNYDCSYEDSDNSNGISTGDKVKIYKNGVLIETFNLSTEEYQEPIFTHLGAPSISYANYPNVEAYSPNSLYFNENNPLKVTLTGENYDALSSFDVNFKITKFADNEVVYNVDSNVLGKNINDGLNFIINSSLLEFDHPDPNQMFGTPQYLVKITIDGEERTTVFSYIESEYDNYSIIIDTYDNIIVNPDGHVSASDLGNNDYEITPDDGYTITSIIVDGVERIDDYNNGILHIDDSNENIIINVEVEEIYEITEGANSTYNNEDMLFVSNGPLSLFESVSINGVLLDPEYYTVVSGSTKVTLKNSYLKTLEPGEYTLSINYSNGNSASTKFYINGNSSSNNPYTYDDIKKYIFMFVISVIGFITIFNINRKTINNS